MHRAQPGISLDCLSSWKSLRAAAGKPRAAAYLLPQLPQGDLKNVLAVGAHGKAQKNGFEGQHHASSTTCSIAL